MWTELDASAAKEASIIVSIIIVGFWHVSSLHHPDKPLKQIMTVLGAGAGFGVVLDGEDRFVFDAWGVGAFV